MINYPITKSYVADWGVQEAVREIIQNALDAGGVDISYDSQEHCIISNTGSFTRDVLLLGNSVKSEGSIGKYGEGMKLAMLVLARANIAHYVCSNGVKYTGIFHDTGFAEETFAIYSDEDFYPIKDTVQFHIFADVKDVVNKVYKKHEPGFSTGGLYVKGLYVSELPGFEYGYNLPEAELDRDRKAVDTGIVQSFAAKQVLKEFTPEEIATLLFKQVNDVNVLVYNSTPSQDKAIGLACAELVKTQLNGARIGWSSYGEDYTKVGYHFSHYAVNVGKCQKPELSAAAKKIYKLVAENRSKIRRDIREKLLALAASL